MPGGASSAPLCAPVGRSAMSDAGLSAWSACSSTSRRLSRLPLVDATAISFAAPLITVAFAALFLGEHVRIYRWSAVVVGFLGVLVMLWPHVEH